MKAYRLSIRYDDDNGAVIVFANTAREAKKQVYKTDLADGLEQWIDLECHRDKRYDGMEGLSDAELACKQWRDGWQWYEMDYPDPDESTDAEFMEWYKSNFGSGK